MKLRPATAFWLIALLMLTAFALDLLAVIAAGEVLDPSGWRAPRAPTPTQTWQWSPPAEHQRAAVHVTAGRNAGSGVYVAHEELRGVLTAAHIVGRADSAKVRFADGQSVTGTATSDRNGHDLAFVSVSHPRIRPLTLAESAPNPGSGVEFVTYGGPDNTRLRSFWGVSRGDGEYSATVISGDSGGAILNDRHQVVGIQSVGQSASLRSDWGVYRGSGSATCGQIRAFVERVHQRLCGPEGCGPGGSAPGGGGMAWERGGKIEFYPPAQPQLPGPGPEAEAQESPPLVPIAPPPEIPNPEIPQSPNPEIPDLAALRGELAELRKIVQAIEARPAPTVPEARPWYLRKVDPRTGKELAPVVPVYGGDTVTFNLYEFSKGTSPPLATPNPQPK